MSREPKDEVVVTNLRRRSKPREEKGLADEKALVDLARTYLTVQHERWPELAAGGELPPLSEESTAALAAEFRLRFLGEEPQTNEDAPAGTTLGGAYLRYSCDNSNPRSLDQQLRNILERAVRERVFVPWRYVFADASVSGTTADRRGYQAAKQAVRQVEGLATLYVDELGRAARDMIETLRLGTLLKGLKKRLVGVSDGFDSATAHWQTMIAIFAAVNQYFVEQLRSKVDRGMRDAFGRGLNVRPPSLGYRLTPATAPDGGPLLDAEGRPLNVKEIDPDGAQWVMEAFRMYVECGWSPERVAVLFNEREAGGRSAWDRGSILQLLRRTTYVGIEYEGMTRRVRDPETEKVTVQKVPCSEWRRRDVPHLRIVSDELFGRAASRLKECSEAFAPIAEKKRRRKAESGGSRAALYPKGSVRPFCACGKELRLGHSTGYGSLCCPDGSLRKNGCGITSYKSARIIDSAIVGWVRENLVTPDLAAAAAEEANRALAEEAAKPRENLEPIRREIQEEKAACERLAGLLERQGDEQSETLLRDSAPMRRR